MTKQGTPVNNQTMNQWENRTHDQNNVSW